MEVTFQRVTDQLYREIVLLWQWIKGSESTTNFNFYIHLFAFILINDQMKQKIIKT